MIKKGNNTSDEVQKIQDNIDAISSEESKDLSKTLELLQDSEIFEKLEE